MFGKHCTGVVLAGLALLVAAAGAPAASPVTRPVAVALAAHAFGHMSVPSAVVARASAREVGLICCADPPGGDGPRSFDVAPDGSVWMLDGLRHRLLVWRAGHPGRPARAVALPRSLRATELALGRAGRLYVVAADTADLSRAKDKTHLYAFSGSGRMLWKAAPPVPAGALPAAPLQVAADGVLWSSHVCGEPCAPAGGQSEWTPLTTPSGRPLSLPARRRLTTRLQPLGGGLRLEAQLSRHAARFTLVDAAGRVVRSWRVTSVTQLDGMRSAPALAGVDLLVPLDVSRGAHWERLVVRLTPTGGAVRLTLAARTTLGEDLVAPVRIASGGRVFELRTSTAGGASVAAYDVAR